MTDMSKKLIVCDLDGTLLKEDKTLSQNSIDYIKTLVDKGVIFILASSRDWFAVEKYYRQLGLDNKNYLVVGNNGANIYNPLDARFDNIVSAMSKETFYALHNNPKLKEYVEHFLVKTKFGYYIDSIPQSELLKDKCEKWFHINFDKTNDLNKNTLLKTENRKYDLMTIVLILKPNIDYRMAIKLVKDCSNQLDVTEWKITEEVDFNKTNRTILEINTKYNNKATAIHFLKTYYDVNDSDVYFFGDGHNDIKALQMVNNSYCMISGDAAALLVANHITEKSNDEDGVVETLKKIFQE